MEGDGWEQYRDVQPHPRIGEAWEQRPNSSSPTGWYSRLWHRIVVPFDNPMPESMIFPSQGIRIWLSCLYILYNVQFRLGGSKRVLSAHPWKGWDKSIIKHTVSFKGGDGWERYRFLPAHLWKGEGWQSSRGDSCTVFCQHLRERVRGDRVHEVIAAQCSACTFERGWGVT